MSMTIKNIIVELLLAGVDVGLTWLGVHIALTAKGVYLSYRSACSDFNKIRGARQVPISDLRAFISDSSSANDIVIVRGVVLPPPEQQPLLVPENRSWCGMTSRLPQAQLPPPNVLISSHSPGEKRAVMQKIYHISENNGEKYLLSTLKKVPFVLVPSGLLEKPPSFDCVTVSLDDSAHKLPLTVVYHHFLQPATPNKSLSDYPNLHAEKILPVGTEISAVGRVHTSPDGNPQIEACQDLPFFLSKMTKAEMLLDLSATMTARLCIAVVLGSVAVGVIAYASRREWRQWKEWRKQRRRVQQLRSEAAAQVHEFVDDEGANGGNSDMPLCVICFMRRRTVVFTPCGHLICCSTCALSFQEDSAPKCPMCREAISDCFKVYF